MRYFMEEENKMNVEEFIKDFSKGETKEFICLLTIIFLSFLILFISLLANLKRARKVLLCAMATSILFLFFLFFHLETTKRDRAMLDVQNFIKHNKNIKLSLDDIGLIFNSENIKRESFVKVIASQEGDNRNYAIYCQIKDGSLRFYTMRYNEYEQEIYLPFNS